MNTNGLESAVRLNRILMGNAVRAGNLTPTQIISCDGLVEEWAPGVFTRGDVRKEGGQVWKCAQSHDSTATPDWTPTSQRALWVPYHSEEPAYARPYIAPTMAEDAYRSGECMLWTDGEIYLCKQDGTVHDPVTLPAAWELVTKPTGGATPVSILDGMTVAQLREYAANHGIDLGGAAKKADIRAAIKAAEVEEGA